jgi:hypothetical protein
MTKRARGFVEAITAVRPGIQELLVRIGPEMSCEASGESGVGAAAAPVTHRPAMNLTELTGDVAVGDQVEVNTVAIDMALGTGGFDFVISILNRATFDLEPPGHIVKLRYTPMQTPVLSIEAPESPKHEAIASFTSLNETPVVCFELHSQLPAICAALQWAMRETGRTARVVYIMTDGAALPIALSRLVPTLIERGMLAATITAGQAFGGEFEAVNVYSALAAARDALDADAIVIGQGPGNVGTGTPLGFSGVDQGIAVNAAASLGGAPIFVPRISFTDERSRHVGISHHTITNLTSVVRAPTLVPIPRLSRAQLGRLYNVLQESGILKLHEAITVDADKGLKALEDSGISVTTMGRGLTIERAFFLAAAAAGLLAAQMLEVKV